MRIPLLMKLEREQAAQRSEVDCEGVGWDPVRCLIPDLTAIIYSHLLSPCFQYLVTVRGRPLARLVPL